MKEMNEMKEMKEMKEIPLTLKMHCIFGVRGLGRFDGTFAS